MLGIIFIDMLLSNRFYKKIKLELKYYTIRFTHKVWGMGGWEIPKVFEFRVKSHLHTLMTGKDLTLPEFYFLCKLCYYKKISLKFLPNYTLGL